MSHKIIFTTDDFGPQPAINKGIIELVRAGKVNSVNVLINFDGQNQIKSSAENLKELLEVAKYAEDTYPDFELEIGCHLTITSGKPVSNIQNNRIKRVLLDSKGNFRDYVKMRRADETLRSQIKKTIKNEIEAQYNKLSDALQNANIDGISKKVAYLNSHHNALFMWPEYSEPLFEFAKSAPLDLPIRSANSIPEPKYSLYKKQISIRSISGISLNDIKAYNQHQKILVDTMSNNNIATTQQVDTRHYGPIPGTQIKSHERLVKKKYRKIQGAISDLIDKPENSRMEMILHVAHSDPNIVLENIDYTGINSKYFKSRKAEFDSVLSYPHYLPAFVRWNDL